MNGKFFFFAIWKFHLSKKIKGISNTHLECIEYKVVGPVTFPTFFLNDVENGTFQSLTTSTKDRALFLLQIRPKGILNTSFCKVETLSGLCHVIFLTF